MSQGRPPIFNDEIAEVVLSKIEAGKSFNQISKESDMPSRRTFIRWCHDNKSFWLKYAEIQMVRSLDIADEIMDIADDPALHLTKERHMQARTQIDARKWKVGKLMAKFPSLTGTYNQQIDQIKEQFENNYIGIEAADICLKMVGAKANLTQVDELKQEMAEIKELLMTKK